MPLRADAPLLPSWHTRSVPSNGRRFCPPARQWEYPGEIRESGARALRKAPRRMTGHPVTGEGAGPAPGPVSQKVAAGPTGSAHLGDSVPSSGDRTRG